MVFFVVKVYWLLLSHHKEIALSTQSEGCDIKTVTTNTRMKSIKGYNSVITLVELLSRTSQAIHYFINLEEVNLTHTNYDLLIVNH